MAHINHRQVKVATLLFTGLAVLCATPSMAQQAGFGIRAGATVNPDQFHLGGHFETGPLIEHLSFRPNLELGFGDHVTTVAFNFEFAYHIPIQRQPFSLYVGAGPALIIYSFDTESVRGHETNAEGGFNFLFGVEHRSGLFGELKVGAIDSPDVKITVGYTFR